MKTKESRINRIRTYEDGKLWFHKKAGGILYIGITSEGLEALGEAESVSLPSEGDDLSKGDVACEIIGSEADLEIIVPASGIVKKANESLESDMDVLNEDPIDDGWLFKMEIQDATDLEEFLEEEL